MTEPSAAHRAWRLCRLDDNGNTFEMARFTSRADAQTARDEFDARGHKQSYWIEVVGATDAAPDSPHET